MAILRDICGKAWPCFFVYASTSKRFLKGIKLSKDRENLETDDVKGQIFIRVYLKANAARYCVLIVGLTSLLRQLTIRLRIGPIKNASLPPPPSSPDPGKQFDDL